MSFVRSSLFLRKSSQREKNLRKICTNKLKSLWTRVRHLKYVVRVETIKRIKNPPARRVAELSKKYIKKGSICESTLCFRPMQFFIPPIKTHIRSPKVDWFYNLAIVYFSQEPRGSIALHSRGDDVSTCRLCIENSIKGPFHEAKPSDISDNSIGSHRGIN